MGVGKWGQVGEQVGSWLHADVKTGGSAVMQSWSAEGMMQVGYVGASQRTGQLKLGVVGCGWQGLVMQRVVDLGVSCDGAMHARATG